MLAKVLLMGALSGEPTQMYTKVDTRKLKNAAIATTFIIAANLLIYSPLIFSNFKQTEEK